MYMLYPMFLNASHGSFPLPLLAKTEVTLYGESCLLLGSLLNQISLDLYQCQRLSLKMIMLVYVLKASYTEIVYQIMCLTDAMLHAQMHSLSFYRLHKCMPHYCTERMYYIPS